MGKLWQIRLGSRKRANRVATSGEVYLAYEGNKRLRDPDRQERRAWTALDPDKTRIMAAYYGKENMADLIHRLELVRDGRISEIDLGEDGPLWKRSAFAVGAGPARAA